MDLYETHYSGDIGTGKGVMLNIEHFRRMRGNYRKLVKGLFLDASKNRNCSA